MNELAIDIARTGTFAQLSVAGEIDLVTSAQFARALTDAIDGSRLVLVDLALVTYMDSQGIRALVTAQSDAAPRGCTVSIQRPSRPVRRVLTIAGLISERHAS